jgi:hypothetical protein
MEELIRVAFSHVDGFAPYVAAGRYDLIGPYGKIILPEVWETLIQPDWLITMHMWPMPEPPGGSPDEATVTSKQKKRPEKPISPAAPIHVMGIEDILPLKPSKKKPKDSNALVAFLGSTNSSGRHKSSGRSKK